MSRTNHISYHKPFKALFLALCILISNAAYAQDRFEVTALQYALKRLGLYASSIDGQMGRGTRNGISTYAQENSTSGDFNGVFLHLAGRDLPWEIEWNDQVQDAVNAALEIGLLDYTSAQFSNLKRLYVGEDQQWVTACVDVNAKNEFGAYAGYRWAFLKGVRAQIGTSHLYTFFMVNLTEYQANVYCKLGFVQEIE